MSMSPRFPGRAPIVTVLLGSLAIGSCARSPEVVGTGTGGASTGSGGATTAGSGGATTTGSGGRVGTGGGAPTTVMKDPSTYPHNTAGAKYPYPQGHALSPNCKFPVYNTDTIRNAYMNWKAKFYQNGTCGTVACGRVIRPSTDAGADQTNPNDVVSEGIAYGMLIGVYMNDRTMFDLLWTYAQSNFNGNGLMKWRIGNGGNAIDSGAATDADQDMAWALLMAAAQWGGSYNASAVTLINNIMNREVDMGGGFVLKPGDNFGGASQTNPSYFAPSYYRAFATATGNANWMRVVDSSYNILTAASGANGLVPNWANSSGGGINGPNNDTNGLHYGYDACRTPWRIALDYCEYGEPRAKAYLDKVTAFMAAQAPIGIGTVRDGYTASGTNPPGGLGDNPAGMSMLGPAGVATMSGGHDVFLTQVHDALANAMTAPVAMNVAGVFTYYQASWGMLSLLTMSGNFWHMTP